MRHLLQGPAGALGDLISGARQLGQIDAALAAVLDPSVHAHVRAARLESGKLTLLADSPAWATRLRYLTPMLREQLDGGVAGALSQVHIAARPASTEREPERPERQAASLSGETATLLEQIADGIADDALSNAVRRVARHGQQRR